MSHRHFQLAAFVCLVLMRLSGAVAAQEMQYNQGELIRGLLPSVVNVTVRKSVMASEAPASASASTPTESPADKTLYGSGFVVDATGVIVTNYHVVEGAWEITVTFSDGEKETAHLYNASRLLDIALLKVSPDHKLTVVRWGDSDALQIGDPVFAIGNPFGLGMSVSGGIVSALNRDIMDSPYDHFIQTDAAINHGNSGGPLFNMKGEVVGIDTALISPTTGSTGLGFAIPASGAQRVVDQLMHYGWLRPGWAGFKVQQVTPEMAAALGMARPMGAPMGSIVSDVVADGPSAKAGLRVGDVILQFGDKAPPDERALLRAVALAPVGTQVVLGLWRDGQETTLPLTIAEWPRSKWEALDAPVVTPPPHRKIPPDLGIQLAALTDASRARYGIQLTQTGVLVTGVAAGTDAAERGLTAGDVILRVQDRVVDSAVEAQEAFDHAREAKRDFVLVLIQPKVQTTPGAKWLALRVAPES